MAITKEILDELLKDCKGPDEFYGPDGLVKQLSKALIERMMQAELTDQLGYEKSKSGEKQTENRRNGKTSKTLRTDQGPMEIEVPRDRDGEYEPKVIPKKRLRRFICNYLYKGYSPEIIAAMAAEMNRRWKTNYETIYQWIYKDRKDLIIYLVKSHKKRCRGLLFQRVRDRNRPRHCGHFDKTLQRRMALPCQ